MISHKELSLKALKKAQQALQDAIRDSKNPSYPAEYMRDAVIQRFEFTFELAWKTLQRYFELNQRPQNNNIKDIFREAGKIGFISSVEIWFDFQKARNLTSHTYSREVAQEVFENACRFSDELVGLVQHLESSID